MTELERAELFLWYRTELCKRLAAERDKYLSAIRRHRDERGDDRCWLDDEALYAVLPEGHTPPARDSAVELDRCRAYVASRHNPATAYVSPQRRIEELEAENAALAARVAELERWVEESTGSE